MTTLLPIKRLAAFAAAATVSVAAAASAAGIDSRAYACGTLQSLIARQGFVFISEATFGDFVVADASFCSGGQIVELRSVTTADNPECIVNYCVERRVGMVGGGM